MGHLSTWLHDHHWDSKDEQKAEWVVVLLESLLAVLVFIALMLFFPGPIY